MVGSITDVAVVKQALQGADAAVHTTALHAPHVGAARNALSVLKSKATEPLTHSDGRDHKMRLLFAMLLATAWPAVRAGNVPAEAMAAVRDYSAALNAFDCQKMLSKMSPSLLMRVDRSPTGRDELCQIVGQFASDGMHERLRAPTASVAKGRYRMVLVPNQRTAIDPESRLPTITSGTYVVHSGDDGKSWYVLDLGCIEEGWVREVFPPFGRIPKVGAGELKVLGVQK